MLWFCVDTHHGQRYFFICGCKLVVKKHRRISSNSRVQVLLPASRGWALLRHGAASGYGDEEKAGSDGKPQMAEKQAEF
jgi:hypothetical protein